MLNTSSVSAKKSLVGREAPRWFIIVVAIIAVAILAYFGYQALLGRDGEPGPRIKVHPGMYDLRGEIGKMRAAHQSGNTLNGR